MSKSFVILSALASSVISLSTFADPITLYGRANVSLQLSDEGNGNFSDVASNASRAGIKGDLALENGMSVIYQIEWEVDLADLSGSDNIKSRDQYVGLKGEFGTVYLGRKNTFTKVYSVGADAFNDYRGDLKYIWKGENRLSESLSYETADLNGFHIGVSYQTKGDEDGEDGVSAGVRYGDDKLKKTNWSAALMLDSDINGYDVQRAMVNAKVAGWVLGAMAHQQKKDGGSSDSGYLVSAQYALEQWNFKGQLQTLEDDTSWSVGADYKLGKSTKAYTWYTAHSLDEKADKSWLAVGLEHKF